MPLLTINELQGLSPVFKGKCGKFLAQGLMDISCVSRINELYDKYWFLKGPDFTDAVLSDLGVRYEIKNKDVMNQLRNEAFITISNHPYGGIDGLILVDFVGHFRPDYKVMVNKVLGRIENLSDNFIDVIFPAGAISDINLLKFRVEDRQWQEPVIRLIKRLRMPVLPIRFNGGNSALFYSLGIIDWRIRLLKLPSELFNKKGKTVKLILGDLISPEQLDEYHDIGALGNFLREKVYNLK